MTEFTRADAVENLQHALGLVDAVMAETTDDELHTSLEEVRQSLADAHGRAVALWLSPVEDARHVPYSS